MRIRSASVRAVPRGRNEISIGRSAPISSFTSSCTRAAKPSGSGSNSKSILASSGSMFPPVTAFPHSFQITPHSTCIAECVRMS